MLVKNRLVSNSKEYEAVLNIGGDICTVDIPAFTNGRFLRYDDNSEFCWVGWMGMVNGVYAVPTNIVLDLGTMLDEPVQFKVPYYS